MSFLGLFGFGEAKGSEVRALEQASSSKTTSAGNVQARRRRLKEKLFQLREEEEGVRKRSAVLDKIRRNTEQKYGQLETDIAQRKMELEQLEDPKLRMVVLRRRQLQEAEAKIKEVQQLIDAVTENYDQGRAYIPSQAKGWLTVAGLLRQSTNASHVQHEWRQWTKAYATGTQWLTWVSSMQWRIIVSLIVLMDVFLEHEGFIHARLPLYHFVNLFLSIYVAELVVNLLCYGWFFFAGDAAGSSSIVWWNYLDVVIVLMTAARQVLATADYFAKLPVGFWFFFRLFRPLRLVKSFRILAAVDLTWVESRAFGWVTVAAHYLTVVLILILEGTDSQEVPMMLTAAEDAICLFLMFRLGVRLEVFGWQQYSFRTRDDALSNRISLVVVAISFIVGWILLPILLAVFEDDLALKRRLTWAMLRCAQYPRVILLLEIMAEMPSLRFVVISIAISMRRMGLLLLFTAFVLYTCTLVVVCVTSNEDSLRLWLGQEAARAVVDTFTGDSRVTLTFYLLFEALNTNMDHLELIIEKVPVGKWLLMAFVILTNWAIYSVLTAVVSDCMASMTETREAEAQLKNEREYKEKQKTSLEVLFNSLDADGDGRIAPWEFQLLLRDEVHLADICHCTGLTKFEVGEMFDNLSRKSAVDGFDFVSRDDFLALLGWQELTISTRTAMKIQRRVDHLQEWLVPIASKMAREDVEVRSRVHEQTES